MLTHWIIGAGQIGCYLAACFQQQNASVSLVSRGIWYERVAKGFVVSDFNNHQSTFKATRVVKTIEEADIGKDDWVWITVKCTGLEPCVSSLVGQLSDSNTVIFCQNGIGARTRAEVILKSAATFPTLLTAMVPFNAVWDSERLHKGSEGNLTLERPDEKSKAKALISLSQPMLEIDLTDNIVGTQWAKLQLNLGNAVNALANKPVKTMLEDRGYRLVIASAMRELLNVCQHNNIKLPKVAGIHGRFMPFILSLPNFLFKRVASQMVKIDPTVKTSMWWDFHSGKETEIDYLQGAVVEAGNKLNLTMNVNSWLMNEIQKRQMKEYNNISLSGEEILDKIWHSKAV